MLAAISVVVFAIEGGEWGTINLIHAEGIAPRARVRREVDSPSPRWIQLKKYRQAVLTDPVMQEKIAREEFGMVKGNKEMLYRYTEPDSASRTPEGGSRKAVAKKP